TRPALLRCAPRSGGTPARTAVRPTIGPAVGVHATGAAVSAAVPHAGDPVGRARVGRALGPAVGTTVGTAVGAAVVRAGGPGCAPVRRTLATRSGRHHVVVVQRHRRSLPRRVWMRATAGPRRP